MAFNDNTRLTLDLKAQDKLRSWFARRQDTNNVVITCVELGDSDIDYELSQQTNSIKILDAPYDTSRIKYKVLYTGNDSNLSGILTTFIREIPPNSIINSLYTYPTNTNFTPGIQPPTLANGKDYSVITFDTLSVSKEGFLVFFQTLPDGYLDSSGAQERLAEPFLFTLTNVPLSWEVILDSPNGSLMISKPDSYIFAGSTNGTIKARGLLSGIERTVTFNY